MKELTVIVAAPTGLAAFNVGGLSLSLSLSMEEGLLMWVVSGVYEGKEHTSRIYPKIKSPMSIAFSYEFK